MKIRPALEVKRALGQATVVSGNREDSAKAGYSLEAGDILLTEKEASLFLGFGAGSEMKLGRTSLVRIRKLYDRQKLSRDHLELKRGSLFVHFNTAGDENDILHLHYAVHELMAYQKSAFLMAIDPQRLDMRLVVLDGSVKVKAYGRWLPLEMGQGLIMAYRGQVSKPTDERWVRMVNWEEVVEGTSLEKQLAAQRLKLKKIWDQDT